MTKADDRIIRVGDAYEYWKRKAQSLTDLKNAKTLRNMLDEVPSAQKKGKWIEKDDGWDGIYYECSSCGEAFVLIEGTPKDNNYYYCPNCGADMEGE